MGLKPIDPLLFSSDCYGNYIETRFGLVLVKEEEGEEERGPQKKNH